MIRLVLIFALLLLVIFVCILFAALFAVSSEADDRGEEIYRKHLEEVRRRENIEG